MDDNYHVSYRRAPAINVRMVVQPYLHLYRTVGFLTCVGVSGRLLIEGDTMATHGWFCIT